MKGALQVLLLAAIFSMGACGIIGKYFRYNPDIYEVIVSRYKTGTTKRTLKSETDYTFQFLNDVMEFDVLSDEISKKLRFRQRKSIVFNISPRATVIDDDRKTSSNKFDDTTLEVATQYFEIPSTKEKFRITTAIIVQKFGGMTFISHMFTPEDGRKLNLADNVARVEIYRGKVLIKANPFTFEEADKIVQSNQTPKGSLWYFNYLTKYKITEYTRDNNQEKNKFYLTPPLITDEEIFERMVIEIPGVLEMFNQKRVLQDDAAARYKYWYNQAQLEKLDGPELLDPIAKERQKRRIQKSLDALRALREVL